MHPKLIVAMILYMLCVYTTVYVFTNDGFRGVETDSLPGTISEDQLTDVDSTDYEAEYERAQNMSWLDSIGEFFGSVVKAFTIMIGLLTFNIVSPYGISPMFTVIPFLMVLPVWIALTFWIAPYVIKALNAIGNWIPFT